MITHNCKTRVIRSVTDSLVFRPQVVNRHEDVVRVKFHPDGRSYFYEVECTKDIKAYINSFKNGASLESMLERISLLPVNERIKYLNQHSGGLTGDITFLPKDGTEAYLCMKRAKSLLPDFDDLVKNHSFNELIQIINDRHMPKNQTADVKPEEVTNNG